MKILEIENFNYKYGDVQILDSISMTLDSSTIVSIIGPSGCGKSTLLNLISNVKNKKSQEQFKLRNNTSIGYMQQNNHMLPWQTVRNNVLLGAQIKKLKVQNEELVKYFKLFELNGYENALPRNLSGGMKQRACLVRVLLSKPNLILIDEGFSNQDIHSKVKMQKELLEYKESSGCTVILVTHNIEDSIVMSDYIYFMSRRPAKFVASIQIEADPIDRLSLKFRSSELFQSYLSKALLIMDYGKVN